MGLKKQVKTLPDIEKSLTSTLILVYDSNDQISAGILSGNVNNYGHFQQCLKVGDEGDSPFRGKHCFAELQPFVTKSATYLSHLRSLSQSFDLMKSQLDDVSTVIQHHLLLVNGFFWKIFWKKIIPFRSF